MTRILKGIGKIDGDGWKDVTKIGKVVYVWDDELPAPFKKGQYPRVGCECWAASTEQYDFHVVSWHEKFRVLSSLGWKWFISIPDKIANAINVRSNEITKFCNGRKSK